MKVLFFGVYDLDDSTTARTRIFLKGLRDIGVEVVECNTKIRSLKRFVILFRKYLKLDKDYDVMFVAYTGAQLVMPLAKILAFLSGKKVVVDPIISLHDTMVRDRGIYGNWSLKAFYYYFLDLLTGKLADIIIFDTNANIEHFSKKFNIKTEKFRRIFIGADEDVLNFFGASENSLNKAENFVVHFHGYFIPLQGVEYIIKAAKILENENICFNIIGKGQMYKEIISLAENLNLKNVKFIGAVPFLDLPKYISESHVVLGIFGNTEKAKRVIPHKVYDALATRKPVITMRSAGIHELLIDRENVLLVNMADENDLAKKILELKNNTELMEKIAENGYRLFKEKLNRKVLAEELKKVFEETINKM